MHSVHFIIFFTIHFFACSLSAQDSSPLSPRGQWINEDKSRLHIDQYDPESGRISGTYFSSSGTDGQGHPLIGWYNPNQGKTRKHSPTVTFSVHWGETGSLTSWTGYIYKKEGQIVLYTLWHLVRPRETHSWERLLTRSSIFVLMR